MRKHATVGNRRACGVSPQRGVGRIR